MDKGANSTDKGERFQASNDCRRMQGGSGVGTSAASDHSMYSEEYQQKSKRCCSRSRDYHEGVSTSPSTMGI